MMVLKGVTLLEQLAMFNEDIREWRRQITDQKTWAHINIFFHLSHRDQRKEGNNPRKRGIRHVSTKYYGVPPTPSEEHHETIYHISTIWQGM